MRRLAAAAPATAMAGSSKGDDGHIPGIEGLAARRAQRLMQAGASRQVASRAARDTHAVHTRRTFASRRPHALT
jgi:hypothetical protein